MNFRVLMMAALLILLAVPGFCVEEGEQPAQGEGEVAPEIEMGDVEIRGELERPDVFYIIPRRKADMDLGSLSKDYGQEIMVPIMPAPFEATYRDTGGRGQ